MNILIVDDKFENVSLIEEMLYPQYNVFKSFSGIEALQTLGSEKIDIVLLDILMPDMDGFEVLKQLRANKQTENLIVIMVTSKIERDTLKIAIQYGASDYIKKPVDEAELLTKLNFFEKIVNDLKVIEEYKIFEDVNQNFIMARRFQECLLPDKKTQLTIFPKSFILAIPKDFICGESYFISEINGVKFVAIFDCVGLEMPASLLSVFLFSSISYIVNKENITDPMIVMQKVHQDVLNMLHKSNDKYSEIIKFEAAFCEINYKKMELKFVGASRPLFIVRNFEEPFIVNNHERKYLHQLAPCFFSCEIEGDQTSLGMDREDVCLTKKTIKIYKNDRFYLYTDGVVNQFNDIENLKYSKRKLYNLCIENYSLPLKEQKNLLFNELKKWIGRNNQNDDILVVGIEI